MHTVAWARRRDASVPRRFFLAPGRMSLPGPQRTASRASDRNVASFLVLAGSHAGAEDAPAFPLTFVLRDEGTRAGGLPSVVRIDSIERAGEPPRETAIVKGMLDRNVLEVEAGLVNPGQPAAGGRFEAVLEAGGSTGSGCGKCLDTRLVLSFEPDPDGAALRHVRLVARRSSSPDWCHEPPRTEELPYEMSADGGSVRDAGPGG